MQKKDLTLHPQKYNEFNLLKLFSTSTLTTFLANTACMQSLARFYAHLLDAKVSAQQAVFTLYAQTASVAALLPLNINLGWRLLLLFIAWQAFKRAELTKLL